MVHCSYPVVRDFKSLQNGRHNDSTSIFGLDTYSEPPRHLGCNHPTPKHLFLQHLTQPSRHLTHPNTRRKRLHSGKGEKRGGGWRPCQSRDRSRCDVYEERQSSRICQRLSDIAVRSLRPPPPSPPPHNCSCSLAIHQLLLNLMFHVEYFCQAMPYNKRMMLRLTVMCDVL